MADRYFGRIKLGALAGALQFVAWASERRTPITHTDIMERYGISRAQAYRWLAEWRDAADLVALLPTRVGAANPASTPIGETTP